MKPAVRSAQILVVEDSDVQALEVRLALEGAGYSVERTASAEDALDILNREIPDLVIADLHLPNMDGRELTRQLKLNPRTRSVPVLMLTSADESGAERAGLESGADAYVEKSRDSAPLLMRVQALLRSGRSEHVFESAPFQRAALTILHTGKTARLQLEDLFSKDGYDIRLCDDAETLIEEAARGEAGDCVIVNLNDVTFDGVETCRTLAQARDALASSMTPFLIVGLGGNQDVVHSAFAAGADDVVPSAAEGELLRLRLKALIRRLILIEEARRLDIERTEAQTAAEQFRILVQGVTDYALYMLDPQGYVATWNAGAERIKGYSAEDIIGRHFSTFYSEDERKAGIPAEALEAARINGRYEAESVRVRKDGRQFWAHVIIDRITDPDGRVMGFAKITRDITERREAAEELQQAREALLQAQKMEAIGQLTGGIAHDFNNMLAGIIGGLNLIQRRLNTKRYEGLDPLIEAALTSANRAASLTSRLLAFGRRQSLDIKPVDVNKVIPSMHVLIERTMGESIQIEFRCKGELWASTDANQLESAVLNLCINARDAMPEGGSLQISTSLEYLASDAAEQIQQPGEYVRISVRDTGGGIAPDVLAKVFDPFFTTKPVGQGTGLGLSMVYGFVRQSGGVIRIDSVEGEGATVNMWLPATDPVVDQAEDVQTAIEPGPAGARILIVEDDAQVRMLVREVLSELGYKPLEAADANAALDIVRSNKKIDFIVSDVGLPGLDGRKFAELARKERPGLKILFMTGYTANAAIRGDFLAEGMDMITKPFSFDLLAAKVRTMITA